MHGILHPTEQTVDARRYDCIATAEVHQQELATWSVLQWFLERGLTTINDHTRHIGIRCCTKLQVVSLAIRQTRPSLGIQ